MRISASLLIVLVTTFFTLVNNQVLLAMMSPRLDVYSVSGAGYILTFYVLMITIMAVLLLLFGFKYLLKPLLIFFLILSAVISYFNQQMGVLMDVDMIRNVFETDTKEAFELMSAPLLKHVFIYGVLPAIAVIFVHVEYKKIHREIGQRLFYGVALISVALVLILLNFKYVTYFSRENRDLRVWVTPLFPIISTVKFTREELKNRDIPFQTLGQDAVQEKVSAKRTVGIMVVGETARADHLSMNGYERETNPYLKPYQKDGSLLNFSNVSSCGTSTAYSVPCMFSFLNKDGYSPGEADKQSNVLDVLRNAKIKPIWIDNNSSCKGVCERVVMRDIYIEDNDATGQRSAFDTKLIKVMAPYINSTKRDTLIILHIMGSHGPAYHRRVPEGFAKFTPYCESSAPQECSDEEVRNAYDNTIRYTDYVLSQIIEYLQQNDEQYESFMFYASDHGESLGENGIYLHGLPYFLAPEAQTHVPMIAWFSDAYRAQRDNLMIKTDGNYSHDNISATLLGLFGVKNSVYDKNLDLFSGVNALK